MFCQDYFIVKKVVVLNPSDIVIIIAESEVWYKCQNRIGNYYHHDGEQFTFIKTDWEKKNVSVIFVLQ